MKSKPMLLWVTLVLCSAGAQAQKLTPGLWEHQVTMKTGSGQMEAAMAQMQAQLAAMPPEKRKQIEAAMGRQGLSGGPAGGPTGGLPAAGQPMTMKVCVTPEQAARDEVPHQQGQCKQTSSSRSGNTVKFTLECGGTPKATGSGEFTLVSPKEHKGQLTITTTRKERSETMEMRTQARWLAAACGDIKPVP